MPLLLLFRFRFRIVRKRDPSARWGVIRFSASIFYEID